MQKIESHERLPYLDGWRTIAVALVILGHLRFNTEVSALYERLGLSLLGQCSYQGVLIFFFISGYVVSKTCFAEARKTGSFSIIGFYTRRIFRIIPPLMIYLGFCLFLSLLGIIYFSDKEFLLAAFYLCNNSLAQCGWDVAHTWSLAFEEQFYLLFPMMFAFIELSRRPSAVGLCSALGIAVIPFIFPLDWIRKTGFVLIYTLFIFGYLTEKYQYMLRGIPAYAFTLIFFISMIITFAPSAIISTLFDSDSVGRHVLTKYYECVWAISIPLMVISTSHSGTLLNRALSNQVQTYLGRASYSIYLWQQVATGPKLAHATLLTQFIALVAVTALCVLQYELLERRLIKLGRRISLGRNEAEAPLLLGSEVRHQLHGAP